jgi:hypothetical protein
MLRGSIEAAISLSVCMGGERTIPASKYRGDRNRHSPAASK